MKYTILGNSDLNVSRICMGFGDAAKGQHSWTIDLVLTDEELTYLEEPYVPHSLAGVMAQNKRRDAAKKHVWTTGAQKIIGGEE